jgi:phosphatidate cytidylyltransferase
MALAAATSVGLGQLFGFAPSWVYLALAGAVLAVWGQIGDLAESALKRHFGVKDSGAIIPGHGGILDRLDGFVFVAPVVTLMLWRMGSAILVGG